jgi:hypothetical protein
MLAIPIYYFAQARKRLVRTPLAAIRTAAPKIMRLASAGVARIKPK